MTPRQREARIPDPPTEDPADRWGDECPRCYAENARNEGTCWRCGKWLASDKEP